MRRRRPCGDHATPRCAKSGAASVLDARAWPRARTHRGHAPQRPPRPARPARLPGVPRPRRARRCAAPAVVTLRYLASGALPALRAAARTCGRGAARPPGRAWDRAWAPVAYDGPATALVAALKFRSALRLRELMAAQIVAAAPVGALGAGGRLVPVPDASRRGPVGGAMTRLSSWRGRCRGRTGLPVVGSLRRTGCGTRQLGAGRIERLQAGRVQFATAAGLRAASCSSTTSTPPAPRCVRRPARSRAAGRPGSSCATWARTL